VRMTQRGKRGSFLAEEPCGRRERSTPLPSGCKPRFAGVCGLQPDQDGDRSRADRRWVRRNVGGQRRRESEGAYDSGPEESSRANCKNASCALAESAKLLEGLSFARRTQRPTRELSLASAASSSSNTG